MVAAPPPRTPADNDRVERAALVDALERGEPRDVLVVLDERLTTGPNLLVRPGASAVRQRVFAMLTPDALLFEGQALPLLGVRLHDRPSLDALESTPGVLRVELERLLTRTAAPSLELIHQPAALARGADGRGTSVAVLDTGLDYGASDFGACSAPGGSCIVAFMRDFAPEDNVRDDSVRHGTNVASIIHSVAPSARLIGLDVFTGTSGSSLHIASALDWAITNRDTYAIVAVNLSLGGGSFTAPCPSDALAVALQRVRDARIIPVVATGNNGYTNAIASPACGPAAVSVGAVDNSSVVTYFSNSSSFTTILAPGVSVSGGGVVMSGTSQATPHVAGSVAALHTAYPNDTVSDAIARLVGTGVRTTDARTGIAIPRVDIGAATAGGATAPPPDVTPPTGTLTVPTWAKTTAVPYTLTASDAGGVASMCLTTATTCTAFVPFVASGTVTVATGDGPKTLRAWLRDRAGNVTATALAATTTLDTSKPTTGATTAVAGVGSVTLTIGASTDTGSGIAAYRVVFSTGTTTPSNCAAGTALPTSTSTTVSHTGLTNGTTYRYRVCAVDRAGNESAGVTTTAMPVAERDAPTGTVVANAGAEWTKSTALTLTLTATDASTVSSVCLSSTSTCTTWTAFAPSKTFTLTAGAGTRTVYAWFRDQWGNTSAAPATDTIRLDATAPSNVAALTAVPARGAIALSWTTATDEAGGSGLAGYVVASALTTAPATCATGTLQLVPASARTAALGGLVDGRTYGYRVCSVDVAGNLSAGVTGTAIPAPEFAPPTGSIRIAAGAAWTNVRAVTIEVTATDSSGVKQVCLSSTATCSAWVTYAASLPFTLGTTQGTQTVHAWFRDIYGNTTTAPVTDTISVDTVVPTTPAVSAAARSRRVELTIANASDTGSGIARYVVISALGTRAPANCTGATTVAEASPRVASVSATSSLGWRVCAYDVAGNVSAGASGVTVPLP